MLRFGLLKTLPRNYKLICSRFASRKSNAPKVKSPIVWIDMEMTGLDVQNDRILEIACIITDNNLEITAEHPKIVINQPDTILNAMNEWCTTTHSNSGLLAECKESTITEAQAEETVLKFLVDNSIQPFGSPLAGNSIYMDRMFLRFHMPRLDAYLNYRLIDVSTIKELSKRWNPALFSKIPAKKGLHRGTDDIKESIDEAKFYKEMLFNTK